MVRETVGLVAYRAGEWAEAIGELRAARRMGGGPGHLAILADCERALGHPEKAIELSRSAQAAELDDDGKVELATVVAGARADLGQTDAALAHLEQFGVPRLAEHPRLAYTYADLLDRAGRGPEALTWFIRAANADIDEDTDALERVEQLAASVGASASAGVEAEPAEADDGEPEGGSSHPAGGSGVTDTDQPADRKAAGPAPTGAGEGTSDAPAGADDAQGSVARADPEPNTDNDLTDDVTDLASGAPPGDLTVVLFSDDSQTGDR